MTQKWGRSHREQLWQIIESGLDGVTDGDLISKTDRQELREAGYVVTSGVGRNYSTPKGEAALRDGSLHPERQIP